MKRQYRIALDVPYTSNFGYAYLALLNPSGSGRRLVLRALEVAKCESAGTATISIHPFYRVSASDPLVGEDMSQYLAAVHPDATLPSGIVCRRNAEVNFASGSLLGRFSLPRGASTAGTVNRVIYGCPTAYSKFSAAFLAGANTNVELPTLNQNEAFVLTTQPSDFIYTGPRMIRLVVDVGGELFSWFFPAHVRVGVGTFSLENRSTSPVKLVSLRLADVGTTDTPTIRLVPIGQLYAGDVDDPTKKFSLANVTPLDSSYGPPSASELALYTDVGFVPFGVPEIAIADSSVGTPKGFNYLHTRDFVGPMYRNCLAEIEHVRPNAMPSSLGHYFTQKGCDLLVRHSGITVNQGEGIALVNTAEAAAGVGTGALAAFGAWTQFNIFITLDIYPASDPRLSLLGLQAGSDVVVLDAGTETVLASADAVTGTWNWDYDPDVVSNVDVCVYRAGSVPYIVRAISLGLAGLTLPVSQVNDRSYANPA